MTINIDSIAAGKRPAGLVEQLRETGAWRAERREQLRALVDYYSRMPGGADDAEMYRAELAAMNDEVIR